VAHEIDETKQPVAAATSRSAADRMRAHRESAGGWVCVLLRSRCLNRN
jgi:hypothetical protein